MQNCDTPSSHPCDKPLDLKQLSNEPFAIEPLPALLINMFCCRTHRHVPIKNLSKDKLVFYM